MLLTQARLFDEPQLATLCLDCIDQNTKDALSADGMAVNIAVDLPICHRIANMLAFEMGGLGLIPRSIRSKPMLPTYCL